MRYIIILAVTLILSLFIIYYHPYLGVYNDQMTIEYTFDDEGYTWNYEIDNNNIDVENISDSKWILRPIKKGITNIKFVYSNGNDTKYEIFYELKVNKNKIYWKSGYGNGLLTYPNPY